ncbi:unnamed protein product [Gordionus sp. m RMFG-2023]
MVNPNPSPSPERAIYGFVIWIISHIMCALYFIWSLLPETVLLKIGITYYPQKYWALALPIYISSLSIFILLFYISLNLIITPNFDSINMITDSKARYLTLNKRKTLIPPILDLTISEANKLLYT